MSKSAASRLHLEYRSSWQHVLHDVAGREPDATIVFERLNVAFDAALASNDVASQIALSAHAMAFMVVDWSRFDGWREWSERFDRADRLLSGTDGADGDVECSLARATGAMASALLRGASVDLMSTIGAQLQSHIKSASTAHQATHMALAGAVLLPFFQMTNAVSDAQVLHARMTDTWSRWSSANDATRLFAVLWRCAWAQHLHFSDRARLPEAITQLDVALAEAAQDTLLCGIHFRRARFAADNALYERDNDAVERGLHAMLAALHPDRPMERAIYNMQAASFTNGRNDADAAYGHIAHMNRALNEAACPASIGDIYRTREAGLYFAMGRYDLAAQAMDKAARNAVDVPRVVWMAYVALAHALDSFERGDWPSNVSSRCISCLSDGLAALRRTSTQAFLFAAPKARGAIFAIALRENIETEFVLASLKLVPVPPPDWADEHWPWAMSLRCLGGFRNETKFADGQVASKATSRPINLLKLIAAHGEQGVTVVAAMDALWPGHDGDQAEHALSMTLQRLRRLFVGDDLIVRIDGWLRLNSANVWTDVRALEMHLDALPTIGATTSESARASYVTRLFDLYRGDCLSGVDEAWAVERAQHYRQRVTATLSATLRAAKQAEQFALVELTLARAKDRGVVVPSACAS